MGIVERKAKEKEELKGIILQGAKKLFVERGIEHTTIRNIADAINYSVGTVYVYFKDKDTILHELHTIGFLQLRSEMQVLFSVTDPMERLKALGRVYIAFAMNNPDMYDLMFTLKAPMHFVETKEKQEWNEGAATFDVLKTTVGQCMEIGYFKSHELEALSFSIWSTVHGMCSLFISNRILKACLFEDPESMLTKGYEEFVKIIDKK